METRYRQIVDLICRAAKEKDKLLIGATRKIAMRPKLIVEPEILLQIGRIRNSLLAVLNYIVPKIDLEAAKKYWDEVDSWEKL